jgi:exopolysaccharide biosynthesis polyprenyl glycosylphosphotransferase
MVLRISPSSADDEPSTLERDQTFASPVRLPAFGAASFSARRKQDLSVLGRLTAVSLPIAALSYPHDNSVPAALLIALTAALWWAVLRIGYQATLRVLGPMTAAAFGTAAGLVAVSAVALWVPALGLSPLRLVELGALIFLFTSGWETLVQPRLAPRQKVLILGTTDLASDVADEARRSGDPSFEFVGVVTPTDDAEPALPPLLGDLRDLGPLVDAQRPDLIVLADVDPGAAVDRLLETSWQGFRVLGISHFFEHAFGRVPLTHISPAWFVSILHLRQQRYGGWSKRVFDVSVALAGFVLAAPIFLLVAIAVRLSGRPVLIKQTRLGERGIRFDMYKFRTMIPAGEPVGIARWAAENDPRVTRVGRVLRRTRLDELPQLWNVIRGQMSIVGPRPERPEFIRVLEESIPFWNRRLLVKPGITGWAQIRGGYAADREGMATKLSYDLWYIRNRTLLLDVAICAKTCLTVVTGTGAR